MEFKLFGPGGSPGSHFQKDLKALLDLDDEAWQVLANWFLTTTDFDSEPDSPAFPMDPSAMGPLGPKIFGGKSATRAGHTRDTQPS